MNRYTESTSTIDTASYLIEALKAELRITGSAQDARLTGLLVLSQSLIERYTFRYLSEREVLGQFSDFTPSRVNGCAMLDCLRAPVFDDSLVSIEFVGVDTNEVLTGFVEPVGEFGECFVTSEPEQNPSEETLYNVTVKFKAGYKEIDSEWLCPEPLKSAVVSLAAYMYSNPLECGSSGCGSSGRGCDGGSSNGIKLPQPVALMLSSYIIHRYDHALYL